MGLFSASRVDSVIVQQYISNEAGIGKQRGLSRCGRMMRAGAKAGIILTSILLVKNNNSGFSVRHALNRGDLDNILVE